MIGKIARTVDEARLLLFDMIDDELATSRKELIAIGTEKDMQSVFIQSTISPEGKLVGDTSLAEVSDVLRQYR
jgi:hypothetical protein